MSILKEKSNQKFCDYIHPLYNYYMLNLILASSLVGLKIASIADRSSVAEVSSVLINPENGKFVGLLISKMFGKSSQIVSSRDILSVDKEGVVIDSQKDIVDIDEIAGATELQKNSLLGCKAKINRSTIGKVIDASISFETMSAVNIYIRNLFNERIIPISRVENYDKKHNTIILEDLSVVKATQV